MFEKNSKTCIKGLSYLHIKVDYMHILIEILKVKEECVFMLLGKILNGKRLNGFTFRRECKYTSESQQYAIF